MVLYAIHYHASLFLYHLLRWHQIEIAQQSLWHSLSLSQNKTGQIKRVGGGMIQNNEILNPPQSTPLRPPTWYKSACRTFLAFKISLKEYMTVLCECIIFEIPLSRQQSTWRVEGRKKWLEPANSGFYILIITWPWEVAVVTSCQYLRLFHTGV